VAALGLAVHDGHVRAALIARNVGAMGQWKGRTACAVRDALMRTTPRSVQLRQLDLVLGLRTGRDRGGHPDLVRYAPR
jgi:transposase